MRFQLFLLRIVGSRVLAAAAMLLAVMQILDLLDVTTDILDRGLGVNGIIYYATLRFPRLVEQVAPLAVLAGGLFAFTQLARENAVTIMRAVGLSTYRLVAMAAPAIILVIAVHSATVELIAPRTDPTLEAWWRDTAPPAKKKEQGAKSFRVGADLVSAQAGDIRGRRLEKIKIYRRDATGRVSERIDASAAVYEEGRWTLQQPRIVRFAESGALVSTAETMGWGVGLKPEDVQALMSPEQTPSAASSGRALEGGGSERPRSYYAVRVQRAFAGPVGILVMFLLTAPVALGNFRNRQGMILASVSLGAGLLFLVADGLLSALGESGALWPGLAAWTAPAVFAALAVTVLLKLEG